MHNDQLQVCHGKQNTCGQLYAGKHFCHCHQPKMPQNANYTRKIKNIAVLKIIIIFAKSL